MEVPEARKRHSPESIAAVLRKAGSGIPIAQLARQVGVHENALHLWKKKYGQLGTAEIREMNELRDENTRLNWLVADLNTRQNDVAGRALKKALKPAKQRSLVGDLQKRYGASQRKICLSLKFHRASVRYEPTRPALDAPLRARIKELAVARVRYGYRRICVLLQREGWPSQPKRVARLYRLEGLSLRAKAPKRRRSCAVRRTRLTATAPNHVWSMDFMHDRLMGEKRRPFRLLTIVDIFTRECLGLEAAPDFARRRSLKCSRGWWRCAASQLRSVAIKGLSSRP